VVEQSLEEVTLLVPMMQAAALRITKILSKVGSGDVDDDAEVKTPRRKKS
jgi:hypothetical protein